MKLPALATVFALSGFALAPTTSHAWWSAPGYGHNGYYGAGPFDSDAHGGFGFSASFSGRGHGNGYNRYAGYHGYPGYLPPPPQPASVSWILHGVNFKFDSDELTPESRQALDTVAATLREHPQQALEVGGHASAEGSGPYNLALSKRRARAVRDYLVAQGVDSRLLTFHGYGESRPLASNVTEPGRILNRRVELSPVQLASRPE
jgi:OmpA family